MRRSFFGAVLLGVAIAAPSLWACLALWFDGPAARGLAGALAGGFALLTLVLLIGVRPVGRAALIWLVAFAALLVWWLSIAPRNEREWQPDVAQLSSAELNGDQLVLRNVRNFEYRSETDFTPHWEERRYDLSKLVGQDLFLSFWGPTLIAHTIMSWEFSDGQHLAVSIETRKEVGESYSALRGFFRQYELYYVFADERDLIGLRSNQRGETVFLYRLPASPETARKLLLDYVGKANGLVSQPVWYNALTHNCTTSIRQNATSAGQAIPLDWRILVNGRLDEYLYEQRRINTSLPLAELRERSNVTARARAAGASPAFAQEIRRDLPQRPAPPTL